MLLVVGSPRRRRESYCCDRRDSVEAVSVERSDLQYIAGQDYMLIGKPPKLKPETKTETTDSQSVLNDWYNEKASKTRGVPGGL